MKLFANGILTLLWAAGTVAMAQAPPRHLAISYGFVAVPAFLPPADDHTDPIDYWADNLGLDSSQQASLKTIFDDQEHSTDALRKSLEQTRAALATAAKANSVVPQIDRLSADLGAIFAQAVAVQAKAHARFYALLTLDQKEKFEELTGLAEGGVAVFMSVVGAGTFLAQ
jgi:Spy/CpxP family protein refolding chaperone